MNDNKILTVTDITSQIKGALEFGFNDVWVQGEISNFKNHTSGHLYFTLKDEGAQISAVMWRSRVSAMLFRPMDGMKVLVRGRITVYEPRGNYQIDCLQIQPIGTGELQLAFERLKERLYNEGLFAEEHKKALPEFPEKIAVVTSPTGAAIHDILSVLSRRNSSVEVIVVPVKVQGIGSAEEIALAIEQCNALKLAEVIIVGRGGGSLEDLWAFNEEIVVRAIFHSKIPIISAVGHEIDFSISDFAADLRAPTPSAAAELVVREREELIENIHNFCYTLNNLMTTRIETNKLHLKNLIQSYHFNRPLDLVRQKSQQLDELERRLQHSMMILQRTFSTTVSSLYLRMKSLDHKLVLKRGYSIVRQNEKIISQSSILEIEKEADVEFFKGTASVKILSKSK